MHTRRQLALLRYTSGSGPPSFNSLSRRFKNSHDSSPFSLGAHLGSVWSRQRKIWRRYFTSPRASATACSSFAIISLGCGIEQIPINNLMRQVGDFCVLVVGQDNHRESLFRKPGDARAKPNLVAAVPAFS